MTSADTSSTEPEGYPFRCRGQLLGPPEQDLFRALETAIGDVAVICPKTRVIDVLRVIDGPSNVDRAARIDRKSVDFLLCDRVSFEPLLVVQMDRWDEAEQQYLARDTFVDRALTAAGLTVFHFRSNQLPAVDQIRSQVLSRMAKPVSKTALQPNVDDPAVVGSPVEQRIRSPR